jgi:hypothetical protein
MANPQQPELARSRRTPALAPDAAETVLSAEQRPTGGRGEAGPIPEDNLPGHHPEHEQDKPDPEKFLAKMHELAQEAEAEPVEAEVVDLREEREARSDARAERIAAAVTAPLRRTAEALEKLRDRL